MAEVIYNGIKKVHDEYNDKPENIRNKIVDSEIVVKRFKEFHGVEKK